ncbi:lysine--tRNA ligase [Methanosarcina sp. KYL-1]|uniref:lysine--tRNA ligase n=1 Tax=Methanosarcina sp. KYL-1 TaxID=2602068 RepID=UPI002100D2C0|nr:lysine--tRNA ligase [Methanosarcina sp. KYL-1]MCQ1534543.1 lysine--tRNA ligase [Methanosarcina sp. KYL-1]
MADIIHWADVIAEDTLQKSSKHLVATGITPSGHIHIGNMREVVTADAAFRALLDRGADAELIYIADTYDPLRKVYPFLPESYAEHVGKPLSEVPCPCGECANYSEHFLKPFLAALKRLGINPKVYRADEMYKEGLYTEAIKTALQKRDEIAKILEEVSGKTVVEEWSPFNPICNECGRLTTTKVTGFDLEAETVNYVCACGHSGTVPMRGGGKLTWRVDWPARWGILGVSIEPFGKDHASRGGSYDTGKRIVEEVYGNHAPNPIVYEWIMLGKQGAMSSSTGVVVSISDMLEVVPPEVLRYLIIRTKPEKHIQFDPGQPLLTLVDEYERLRAKFRENDPTLGEFEKRIYELSRATGICQSEIPFKQMVTIFQVARGDFEQVLKIVERSGFSTENETCIRELADNVSKWLELYAPPFAKFSVKDNVPVQVATLSELQKAFLGAFSALIEAGGKLTGEDYHMLVYSAKEQGSELNLGMEKLMGAPVLQADPKELFKAIYTAILGQSSGPKAGWFLSSFEKEFLVQRFREASVYTPEKRS